MTLDKARACIGWPVIYRPHGAGPEAAERGVITEVREAWREGYADEHQGHVMVRYEGDTMSKATAPELLRVESVSP